MIRTELTRDWQPDEAAFRRLLSWLDDGTDSDGERYLEMRERLVEYFGRRRCPAAEDLADETLNRVARRLQENGAIDDIVPARYCYITAKFVFLESLRRRGREGQHTGKGQDDIAVADRSDEKAGQERTFACLERCLEAHTPAERTLILAYYRTDSENARQARKRLAERLGLTANSLAIRACRIRSRLEACVKKCADDDI